MHIKTHKQVTGIPSAKAVVAAGETDAGARQVNLTISAVDAFDMPTVVSSLRLSSTEAFPGSRVYVPQLPLPIEVRVDFGFSPESVADPKTAAREVSRALHKLAYSRIRLPRGRRAAVRRVA